MQPSWNRFDWSCGDVAVPSALLTPRLILHAAAAAAAAVRLLASLHVSPFFAHALSVAPPGAFHDFFDCSSHRPRTDRKGLWSARAPGIGSVKRPQGVRRLPPLDVFCRFPDYY